MNKNPRTGGGPGGPEDLWLDDILSAPPPTIADNGFSRRVMLRIRLARHFRSIILGSAALAAAITLLAISTTKAFVAVIDALAIGRTLIGTIDFKANLTLPDLTSPVTLALLAAMALMVLLREQP